jgi:alkylation response protein AidB-like acyl-CoA dehydrogenase
MTKALPTLLATVEELVPLIEASADENERARRLATPVVEAMSRAGLFRLWVPQALGGAEADVATMVRVVEAVSRIDGAAGWCMTIASNTSLPAGYLPPQAARDIYAGDPLLVTAGTWPPLGVATAVEGGYRANGRWPFASGCQHSGWIQGGCRIMEGDKPLLEANGTPVVRVLHFPAASCEILGTWDTSGLRGTGSHDFTVSDIFVPAAHTVSFHAPPVEKGPLYTLPIIALSATSIAAVSLGIARHAIDILEETAGVKVAMRSQQVLSRSAMLQVDLGRAEGLLRSGRALLFETIDEIWRMACDGQLLGVEDRALLSLAATQATDSAIQAVDLAFRAAGSASIYTNTRLERCLRDVRTVGHHIAVARPNYELVGQALLGFDMRATSLMRADERFERQSEAPEGLPAGSVIGWFGPR